MAPIKIKVQPFKATINLGLRKHYTKELFTKTEIIHYLQAYQKAQLKQKGFSLSISVKESLLVFANQKEPHLELSVINYPKFPMQINQLKRAVEHLTQSLMNEFQQNRVIIEYLDETVMFEKNDELDPDVQQFLE